VCPTGITVRTALSSFPPVAAAQTGRSATEQQKTAASAIASARFLFFFLSSIRSPLLSSPQKFFHGTTYLASRQRKKPEQKEVLLDAGSCQRARRARFLKTPVKISASFSENFLAFCRFFYIKKYAPKLSFQSI
jgi:hypothetical protein